MSVVTLMYALRNLKYCFLCCAVVVDRALLSSPGWSETLCMYQVNLRQSSCLSPLSSWITGMGFYARLQRGAATSREEVQPGLRWSSEAKDAFVSTVFPREVLTTLYFLDIFSY